MDDQITVRIPCDILEVDTSDGAPRRMQYGNPLADVASRALLTALPLRAVRINGTWFEPAPEPRPSQLEAEWESARYPRDVSFEHGIASLRKGEE